MNHLQIAEKIAGELGPEPDWRRCYEHQFRHDAAGVQIAVYRDSITVMFGQVDGERWDKAMSVSTVYTPTLAVAAALEVARALVTVRMQGRPEPDRMFSRDAVLLIAARRGPVRFVDLLSDPLWLGTAGWIRPPGAAHVSRAIQDLRANKLATDSPLLTLTDEGRATAERLARRHGIDLTDPT